MSQNLSQEKILLIGPDGQVGNALTRLFAAKGVPVVLAGQSLNSTPPYQYHLDLTNVGQIEQVLWEVRPTIIINPAAYTAVDKAETERDLATAINSTAPGVIGRIAQELGAFVVHYSTDYVFDGSGTTPRDETALPNPINFYGASKREGELALEKSGANHVILRTSWVFSDIGHNFVKTMLKLGQEREELRIVSDQIGAPTSARMLAEATWAVLEKVVNRSDRGKGLSGIYHCCCQGESSWCGFAEQIFGEARRLHFPLKIERVVPIESVEYPTPAKRPFNSRLDCRKFIKDFSYSPGSWQDELNKTLLLLEVN